MRDFNKKKIKTFEKNGTIYIPEGIKIVIYYGMNSEPTGDKYHRSRLQKVSASQIAHCYGLGGYSNLILVNDDREENIRGLDLSECLELGLRYDYPRIDFYKPSKTIDVVKKIQNT